MDRRNHLRPRSRCENNIKMYIMEIKYEDFKWIHLLQGRYHYGILKQGNGTFVYIKDEFLASKANYIS
jgi:hypothetical protein